MPADNGEYRIKHIAHRRKSNVPDVGYDTLYQVSLILRPSHGSI